MLSQEISAFLLILLVDMVLSQCNDGCKSCSGPTCTSCESSYFLTRGVCSPCPNNCESCNSWDDCTLCKPNNYGLHARCVFNCDGSCLNNECNDATGYCTQCKPGFYGFQCQHNCSLCENQRCDLRSCSNGCTAEYYENKSGIETICQRCPPNCKHCTDWKTCYICQDGFHLFKSYNNVYCISCLQLPCPVCVIQGCNQCQVYDESLVCADCPVGQRYSGKTCEPNTFPCSKECSTYCDNTEICYGECNEGWTGEKCSERCNSQCLKCSKDNGNICQMCVGNFYSTDCSLACNPACVVRSGEHTCEQARGYCLNSCNQTFWGDTCDKHCPDGCKDLKCDRNNGLCTDGCKDGLTGDKCTQTTTIGEQEVTTSQTGASSHQTEGTLTVMQEKKESNKHIIGAASGGGVLILILIIVGVCMLKRRKRSPRGESDQHEVVVAKDQKVNPPSADLYYNTASLVRSRIQISDLLEYARKKTDYEDEFEKLPKGLTRP